MHNEIFFVSRVATLHGHVTKLSFLLQDLGQSDLEGVLVMSECFDVYCVCFEMFWNSNLNLAVHEFWMQCYVFEALAMLAVSARNRSLFSIFSNIFPGVTVLRLSINSMPASSLCSFSLANCLFFCKKPNKYHNITTDLWPLWHTTHDSWWSLNGMQSPGWQGNIRKPSVSDQCGEHDQLPSGCKKHGENRWKRNSRVRELLSGSFPSYSNSANSDCRSGSLAISYKISMFSLFSSVFSVFVRSLVCLIFFGRIVLSIKVDDVGRRSECQPHTTDLLDCSEQRRQDETKLEWFRWFIDDLDMLIIAYRGTSGLELLHGEILRPRLSTLIIWSWMFIDVTDASHLRAPLSTHTDRGLGVHQDNQVTSYRMWDVKRRDKCDKCDKSTLHVLH